jgi:integrase
MATLEGKLVRNVAKLVKPPEHTPRERDTWSRVEVRKFLAAASRDRLHAAWRLSLYGLRRGEVLGLRWSDIDLKAKTLTVGQARLLVEYKVRIEEPKSHNGRRTLPLDNDLVDALTELHKRQMAESAAAGPAYRAGLTGLDWYRAVSTWSPTNWACQCIRNGTQTSSVGCSSGSACAASPCTTHGIRP